MLQKKGVKATMYDKVQMMIPGWERMILKFRGDQLKPDKRANARKAAIDLGNVYLNHSTEKLGIKLDTPLMNGMAPKTRKQKSGDQSSDQSFGGL